MFTFLLIAFRFWSKVNRCVYLRVFYEKVKMKAIGSLVLGVTLMGCSVFGTSPDSKRISKYQDSKNFDGEQKVFKNRRQGLIQEMWDRNMSLKNIFSFFKERKNAQPNFKLPEVKPDMEKFLQDDGELKTIWFGHSSFLLNMNGKIILVDPVFSNAASPVSFAVNRFQAPILSLEELPEIDYILISHDHYDHLDMESIKFFKDKKTPFITPLGVGSHIEGWGIAANRIIEKDWWQDFEQDGIKFIATPAQHFSGRGLFDRNETLWASWVIQSKDHNVYFSGDSGYDVHFKDIGDKYGPFDVAFLESGQYNEKWEEVHMLPKDAVKAYKDLKAKKYFPIHWGMFVLAYHTWFDPIEQLFNLSIQNDVNLVTPKIGQMVNLKEDFQNELWWQPKVTSINLSGKPLRL